MYTPSLEAHRYAWRSALGDGRQRRRLLALVALTLVPQERDEGTVGRLGPVLRTELLDDDVLLTIDLLEDWQLAREELDDLDAPCRVLDSVRGVVVRDQRPARTGGLDPADDHGRG
jgi:hypothetical protein